MHRGRIHLLMPALRGLVVLALAVSAVVSAFCPSCVRPDRPAARPKTCVLARDQKTAKGERFASWFDDRRCEVATPQDLVVEGTALPGYVRGDLIRNGPAVWQGADRAYEHAFDGLAKLLKFSLFDGRVSFSTRFVQSNWFKAVVANALPVPASVTVGRTDPPFSTLQNIWGLVTSSRFDNAPVNIHQVGGDGVEGGQWTAISDAPVAISFDPETLDTKARLDTSYPNSIVSAGGVQLFTTAHPKRCPLTGQSLHYYLEIQPAGPSNIALIVRTDKDLKRTVVGRVEVGPEIPYVHDMSVTASGKLVLVLPPLRVQGVQDFIKGPFFEHMNWKPELGTRVFVFDLGQDGLAPVATHRVRPCFTYHHVNACDTPDGGIIVDLCAYESPEIVTGDNGFCYLPRMRQASLRRLQARDGGLWRLTLPPAGAAGTGGEDEAVGPSLHQLPLTRFEDPSDSDLSFELPTVSPQVKGRDYRFFYAYTGFSEGRSPAADFTDWAVVKAEIIGGSQAVVKMWKCGQHEIYPSEPLFVPDPAGSAEDDGIVLVTAFDAVAQRGLLVWLDAKDMTPLGRAYAPVPTHMAFHGVFVPK